MISKQDVLSSLWIEKYRPKELSDMAMSVEYREKFDEFLKNGMIPNMLLSGSAGTGKSTIAKIFLNKLDCDYEFMNASDERGIEVIRNKVKNFAMMATFKRLKVMVLDEADQITPDAQMSLRGIIEQYSKNTRFVLTCNYLNQIIDPIQSRCQPFIFSAYPKEEVKKILVGILMRENIGYDPVELDKHLNLYYPDMRRCINMMQQGIRAGKFVYKDKQDLFAIVLTAILAKDLKVIRQQLANNVPDYVDLYRYIYDNIGLFPEKARLQVLLDAAEYLYRTGQIADEEINFTAFCINVFKVI